MQRNHFFLAFLFSFFLNGCFSDAVTVHTPSISNDFYLNNIYLDNEEKNYDAIYNKKKTNFFALTHYLIEPICQKIESNKILYVTDFVNESNFSNKSQLGFLLSNNLKVNVLDNYCKKDIEIKSFELAENLKIGGDGSKILSRKLMELRIKNLDDCNQILVGTYIFTKKQVIFYLKLINLESGNIVSSNYIATPLTFELEELEGMHNSAKPFIFKPLHL